MALFRRPVTVVVVTVIVVTVRGAAGATFGALRRRRERANENVRPAFDRSNTMLSAPWDRIGVACAHLVRVLL